MHCGLWNVEPVHDNTEGYVVPDFCRGCEADYIMVLGVIGRMSADFKRLFTRHDADNGRTRAGASGTGAPNRSGG